MHFLINVKHPEPTCYEDIIHREGCEVLRVPGFLKLNKCTIYKLGGRWCVELFKATLTSHRKTTQYRP